MCILVVKRPCLSSEVCGECVPMLTRVSLRRPRSPTAGLRTVTTAPPPTKGPAAPPRVGPSTGAGTLTLPYLNPYLTHLNPYLP